MLFFHGRISLQGNLTMGTEIFHRAHLSIRPSNGDLVDFLCIGKSEQQYGRLTAKRSASPCAELLGLGVGVGFDRNLGTDRVVVVGVGIS